MASSLPTVRLVDVAKAAKVSVSAASVALNGRPGVSQATRDRVQAAACRLGYQVNAAAATMRSGRSRLVGIAADPSARWVPAAVDVLAGAGRLAVIVHPGMEPLLQARAVDAVIAHVGWKEASAWAKSGKPLVVIGDGRAPRGALRIVVDRAAAVRLAIEHLSTGGAKKFLLLDDAGGSWEEIAATQAKAMKVSLIAQPVEGGLKTLRGAKSRRPDAVIAAGDAAGLAAWGLGVPVVALGGGHEAVALGLSVINLGAATAGAEAVTSLLDALDGGTGWGVEVEPVLIAGASSRC